MPDERMMPNDALRLLFLAIEEVMGSNGMKAVLHGAKLEIRPFGVAQGKDWNQEAGLERVSLYCCTQLMELDWSVFERTICKPLAG